MFASASASGRRLAAHTARHRVASAFARPAAVAASPATGLWNHASRPSTRALSNFSFLSLDDDTDTWPRTRTNTVLNVCPQGNMMVVERLGKLHDIKEGGWFMAIPFVDEIKYVVDMREKALNIKPQAAITKDNVHVSVSGNIFCQFIDAEKAAYGSGNPIYALRQHAQSAMRAAIGELELDEILHARAHLNKVIKESVQEASTAWGLNILRYEITEIAPDKFIMEAMDKQAAAERDRRKKVLEAEGAKRSAELQSEGEKIRMKNVSEGALIQIKNEAEAKKIEVILQGEAEAEVIRMRAAAQAKAIDTIAGALSATGGEDAAKLAVAREYITMYSEIGQKSNTMIFSDKPADVNALLAQATSVVTAAAANTPTSPISLDGTDQDSKGHTTRIPGMIPPP